MAAYEKLDQKEYNGLVKQIQTFGADKYQAGTAGSLSSALKYGGYLIGGIAAVVGIKQLRK